MTVAPFSLPEVVNLSSARPLAEALVRYIGSTPAPVVAADRLQQAGLPLLQILVAGRRHAEEAGKTFRVDAPAGGPLARALAAYGLDPALCGASAPSPEGPLE